MGATVREDRVVATRPRYRCLICHDMRYVYLTDDVHDPRFGLAYPCPACNRAGQNPDPKGGGKGA